ncbi:MAG: hypothetical protein JO338_06230 [Aquitalea sp.]|nr:hypothetical protein [Aquitalea sp.]
MITSSTAPLPAKAVVFKPIIDGQHRIINKLTHAPADGGLVTDIELEMKLDKVT